MLNPIYTNGFLKDVELAKKRGKKTGLMREVIDLLLAEIPLPKSRKNHKLVGNWTGRWECHIAPNWLLVYRLDGQNVILERTGSHSDLF